ncbi:MAG: hypothetical protein ABL957_01965 [Parvularculaceae bacterium]
MSSRSASIFRVWSYLAALAASLAAAPARADEAAGALALDDMQGPELARRIYDFDMSGMPVSLMARGRLAGPDIVHLREPFDEERAMRMPGYPQPAAVTFEIRISY